MLCAMRTDVGKLRRINEDAVLVMPGSGVYAVADGMGGHNAGDVASNLAVESIKYRLRGKRATPKSLQNAVQETNIALLRRSQEDSKYQGMGTTLTMLCFQEQEVLVAHVGDSRCYRYRSGELTQCTQDHSVVAELMRQGVLTEEEARKHPYRNVITRALGTAGYVEAEVLVLDLLPGDRFLLCSDGLTGMVPDERLAEFLGTLSIEAAADAMLATALDAGGRDNISLILLEHDGGAGA